jgi:hypothetical protein
VPLELQNLATLNPLNYFLQYIKQFFDLRLLLNVFYIKFAICDNGPSCIPRSAVILFKSSAREKVSSESSKHRLNKVNSKGYKYSSIFSVLLIYIKSVSTVDDSTLQTYRVRVVLARFKRKFQLYIYIVLRRVYKVP